MKPSTTEPLAQELTFSQDELAATLQDGRRISVPLAFYPTLLNATPEQRGHYEVIGRGEGFYWPDLDLHLSTSGMLAGTPERVVPEKVRERWRAEAEALAERRRAEGKTPA